MKIIETPLADAYVLSPSIFEDSRGYFFESFNEKKYQGTVLEKYDWVQENESKSEKGVLRGLHFQKGDYAQAKLVRVIQGEVFDVAVDLRKSSPTFSKSYGVVLSGKNKKQFLVPRGFAHGFLVLSEYAIFTYKCDNYYAPSHDSGIIYSDPELNVEWPKIDCSIKLSEKDEGLPFFKESYKFEL